MTAIKITLKPEPLAQAVAWRTARGIEVPENFEGPKFDDVKDFAVDEGFAWVQLEDVKYCYPVDSIARIAFYK